MSDSERVQRELPIEIAGLVEGEEKVW